MLTSVKDFACGIINKKIKIKRIENVIENSDIPIGSNFSVAIGMVKFAQLNIENWTKTDNSTAKSKNKSFLKKTLAWIENNL